MNWDVADIDAYYRTAEGHLVARILSDELAATSSNWSNKDEGQRADCLAVGYVFSLLSSENLPPVLMPAEYGALSWQTNSGVPVACIDSTIWPIASDLTRAILMVHALEHVKDHQGLLNEAARVLAGSGELILIVSHRRGLWARTEKTPFGQGTPFSRRQIIKLLETAGFEILSVKHCLFIPPSAMRLPAHLGIRLNQAGRFVMGVFGGALIIKATKNLYSARYQPSPSLQRNVRRFIVKHPTSTISSRTQNQPESQIDLVHDKRALWKKS